MIGWYHVRDGYVVSQSAGFRVVCRAPLCCDQPAPASEVIGFSWHLLLAPKIVDYPTI